MKSGLICICEIMAKLQQRYFPLIQDSGLRQTTALSADVSFLFLCMTPTALKRFPRPPHFHLLHLLNAVLNIT